jgi:hypothetical protein
MGDEVTAWRGDEVRADLRSMSDTMLVDGLGKK